MAKLTKHPAASEANLRKRILKRLKLMQAHYGDALCYWSLADGYLRGLPDITGVFFGKAFFFELKAEDGAPTRLQLDRLQSLAKAGAYVLLIYAAPRKGSLQAIAMHFADDGNLQPPYILETPLPEIMLPTPLL